MKLLRLTLLLSMACATVHGQQLVIDNQGHAGIVTGLAFTQGGQTLISTSTDKTVRLWDVGTGSLTKTYRFEQQSGPNGAIYSSAISANERFMFLGGFFGEPGGNGNEIGQIKILDLQSEKMLPPMSSHSNVVVDMEVSYDGKRLISLGADRVMKIWDIGALRSNIQPSLLMSINVDVELNCIAINSTGTLVAGGDAEGYLWTWDIGSGSSEPAKSKIHKDEIRYLAYTNAGNNLYSCGDDGQVIKWTGNGKFQGFFAKLPGPVGVLEISNDDKYLTAMGRGGMVYDLATGSALSSFEYHTNSVSAITSAPFTSFDGTAGNFIASAGGDNKNILLWKVGTGDLLRNFVGSGNSVFAVGVDKSSDNRVAFGQSNPTGNLDDTKLEKVFDLSELRLDLGQLDQMNFRRSKVNGNGKILTKESASSFSIGGQVVNLDEAEDGALRSFSYVQDDAGIVAGSSFSLKKFTADGELLGAYKGHEGETWAVSELASRGILLSGNSDQTIKFWNINNGENILTLFVASDNEWVIWTPQGFYEASAGGEKYIGWHINKGKNKLAEFHDVSAFSRHFHRRDVIEKMLELKSFESVAQEMNLSLKPEEEVIPPEVLWVTPEAATSVVNGNSTVVTFTIKSKIPVTQVKLLADGRTIVNETGISISGDDQPEDVDITLTVPEGNNSSYAISLFVADARSKITSAEKIIAFQAPDDAVQQVTEVEISEDGEFLVNETADNTTTTTSTAEPVPANATSGGTDRSRLTLDPVKDNYQAPANLYVVSIGVSKFANPDYNLNFAEADANSISALFKGQKGKLYKNVKTITLLNEKATRAKILSTFAQLEKYTTVNDMVIIFMASHGMNIDNQFYFVPHDGDAKKARITCVDWRDFSDVVGNMPAKVVLFIDTCHSGQLGTTMPQKQQDNTEAVREMSSKEYGVVVMAAATGYEYSLEHPDWGHGAFTLSLIEGLGEGKADIKPDGIVHLRELDYYLAERVRELTGDRQHPTTQKPSSISRLQLAKTN